MQKRFYTLEGHNISSSTSHKNSIFLSFCLSLQKFKKILPNSFIYEMIVIKICVNKFMNVQIFHFIKGHLSAQKVTLIFSLNLILVELV